MLLNDCNTDIYQGIVLYDKSGASLATTTSISSNFTPASPDQWRNEAIDLSAYIGQNNLQLAFVGFNDYGNNLYLDNISLTTTPIYDIVLEEVIAPSPVTCLNQVPPKLRIGNAGTLISSLNVNLMVNGQASTQTFTGSEFSRQCEMEIELTSKTLPDGENEISFELTDPDDETDFNPVDNAESNKTIVNKADDPIPFVRILKVRLRINGSVIESNRWNDLGNIVINWQYFTIRRWILKYGLG